MTIGTENSHHHFLMVGTAPPTRCGLASYTNNLANAMTQGGHDISILRLLDENDSLTNEPSQSPSTGIDDPTVIFARPPITRTDMTACCSSMSSASIPVMMVFE